MWNKISDWFSAEFVLFIFVLIEVHGNVLLDVIEVVQEVMLSVVLNIVCWSIDLPVVSQTFSSLIKFNELLKLEVGTSKSVFKPIDALPFNHESKDHSSELHGEISGVTVSRVHVDTC